VSGDRIGAALAVARVLVDVGSGGMSSTTTAGLPARHAAHHVVKVAKHTLKQKTKNRMREAAVKLSLTAIAASAETRICAKMLRKPASLVRARLARLGLTHMTRQPETDERKPFSESSSRDAQLHAILAKEVYKASSQRRGILAPSFRLSGQAAEGNFWYAYVGGNSRHGFWYCPEHGGHLVLAERGTCVSDLQDLGRDMCIAIGKSTEAIHARTNQAHRALLHQLHCHHAARVTATGHSLGGAVVARLASSEALHQVHVFNPGGLPDLQRYVWSSMFTTDKLHVHRIEGDVISLGFLPLSQETYSKKTGLEEEHPHKLLHFLPSS